MRAGQAGDAMRRPDCLISVWPDADTSLCGPGPREDVAPEMRHLTVEPGPC